MAMAWKVTRGKNSMTYAERRIPESMLLCYEMALMHTYAVVRRYTYEVCLFNEARQYPALAARGSVLGVLCMYIQVL
jgi:hypothetical protein